MAENAYPLRLESSVFGTANAASSLKLVGNPDGFSKLEVVNGSAIYLDSAIAGACDYTLFGESWLGTKAAQPKGGALRVGRGTTLIMRSHISALLYREAPAALSRGRSKLAAGRAC